MKKLLLMNRERGMTKRDSIAALLIRRIVEYISASYNKQEPTRSKKALVHISLAHFYTLLNKRLLPLNPFKSF